MITLLYGQPASGKTTLAKRLKEMSKTDKVIHLDGDEWREITDNKDYSKEGRLRNLKGAFDMALYLEKMGYDVLLSFVTPYKELRDYLERKAEKFVQVHLYYDGDRGRNDRFVKEFEQSENVISLDTSKLSEEDCLVSIYTEILQKLF
jgi:adenylylsulfate kinase-like enzyme